MSSWKRYTQPVPTMHSSTVIISMHTLIDILNISICSSNVHNFYTIEIAHTLPRISSIPKVFRRALLYLPDVLYLQ